MFCVFQDEKDGEEKGRKYLEKGNIFFRDVEECMSMTFYITNYRYRNCSRLTWRRQFDLHLLPKSADEFSCPTYQPL